MNTDKYIQVEHLQKTYRVKQKTGFWKSLFNPSYKVISAIKSISFTITKGEMVGIIGPNGAGKTTTLKVLSGILWPTAGSVTIGALTPWLHRKKHVSTLGAVFGQRKSMWPELSVRENLELIGSIYKMKNATIHARISELSTILSLHEFLDQPARKLSLGQQMKAELAGAVIHNPKLLILDEPTIGMDIVAKADFLSHLQSLNKQHSTTILLTSHDLHEIQSLCKRIIIINHGEVIYDGNISDILSSKLQLTYTHKNKQHSMLVEKKDIKSVLSTLPFDDIQITEVPIEEVIREYYLHKEKNT